MELFATTVVWDDGGKLTVYDKTQGVQNVQRYLCSVFEIEARGRARRLALCRRRVRLGAAPAISGASLAVLGALALERSVRLVLTRAADVRRWATGRPRSSASRSAPSATARSTRSSTRRSPRRRNTRSSRATRPRWSGLLYKSPNAKYVHKVVPLDLPTPCDMRAPGAATGVYALECAMDELAVALKHRSGRAAAAQLFGARPERGQALHEQGAARVLPGKARDAFGWASATPSRARCATARRWSAGAWRPASGRRCRWTTPCASC